MQVSAYIPAHNAAATIERSIAGLRAQHVPAADFFVVDDGSTDGTVARCERLGVAVLRLPTRAGRGAARAAAMTRAQHELVVCCDAGNVLAPEFISRGTAWFDDPHVAAVYGKLDQPRANNAVERWRGRHLYRLDDRHDITHAAHLATFGAIVRKSAVLAVGNFDARRRAFEDRELSERLQRAGWDIVYDPGLALQTLRDDSLSDVLERYARWYPADVSVRSTLRELRALARKDALARDPGSLAISLLLAAYRLAR